MANKPRIPRTNLKQKLGIGLIATTLGLGGCTGLGAVMQTSDDPAARALGTIMYHEGRHEQRVEEAEAGRSQVNVNVGGTHELKNYGELIYFKETEKWVYIPSEGGIYVVNQINGKFYYEKNKEQLPVPDNVIMRTP